MRDPTWYAELPQLITVQELARLTAKPGQRESTRCNVIRRQIKEGEIPAAKLGKQFYMDKEAVLAPLLGRKSWEK